MSSDVTGVGTARDNLGACEYGQDKAIFMSGALGNLVSNAGVVASDVSNSGTSRNKITGCSFN